MELHQGQSWEVSLSHPSSGPMWGHTDEMEEWRCQEAPVCHHSRMGTHPTGAACWDRNTVSYKSISRLLISSEDLLGPNLWSVRNARTFP